MIDSDKSAMKNPFSKSALCRIFSRCLCAGLFCLVLSAISDTQAQLTKMSVCETLEISDDNCNLITAFSSFDPANRQWRSGLSGPEMTTYLRSDTPPITNGTSCLVLTVPLPAGTPIIVRGRIQSGSAGNRLEIRADNTVTINAPANEWGRQTYTLGAAVDSLRFCYITGANVRSAEAAWIDSLTLLDNLRLTCLALDMDDTDCAMIRSVSLSPDQSNWSLVDRTSSVAGGFSISSQQGLLNNQSACLTLNMNQPLPANSIISVSNRVHSQGGFDQLQIIANDNLRLDTISAERPDFGPSSTREWRQQSYFLPIAASALSWCYSKDDERLEGLDKIWIDTLSFETSEIHYRTRICEALDLATDQCAMIRSVTYNPPQLLWVITDEFSVAGGSSLRSADVGDGNTTCLSIGMELPINSLIRFSRRSSSEGEADFLYFNADQHRQDTFSAPANSPPASSVLRDWEQGGFQLAADTTTLSWCYTKDNAAGTTLGFDSAWIDELSFETPIEYVCAALDIDDSACSMIRTVDFDPPAGAWRIDQAISLTGNSSMRSTDISHNERSCLILGLTLSTNSVVSVAGRTSSEGGVDQLQVYAGELRLNTISAAHGGSVRDWVQQSYFLPATVTTLSWCYAKDSAGNRGSDSAWIDTLRFSTSNISYQTRICDVLDIATDQCAMIQSVSYDPPELLWVITSATSVTGGSSLRSGDVDHSQSSCLQLGLSLPANSIISVAGRTSSEGGIDQLQVYADNLRLDTLSASHGNTESDWLQQTYYLPAAITALRWCYTKDGANNQENDSAWIDTLRFSTSSISWQTRICDVLDLTTDQCAMIQSVSYDPPQLQWVISSRTSVAGGTSLRSADISDDQSTCLLLDLSLPANAAVLAANRTSSEGGIDQLQIDADNLRLNTISADHGDTETGWRQERHYLPAAVSTLRWCYSKDSANSLRSDTVWIDNLNFSTSNIPFQNRICDALDLTTNQCARIQSISYDPPELLWVITSVTSVAGETSLRSADIGNDQSTCLVLGLSLPVNSFISISNRTSSEGSIDRLLTRINNQRLDILSAAIDNIEKDWAPEIYYLSVDINSIRWCYTKDSTNHRGTDSVWIDELDFGTSNIPYKNRICDALDLSAGQCTAIDSIRFDPPEFLWNISLATSVAGGTSLRSPQTDNGQSNCLLIDLSLPANSVISVAGRTRSEGGVDQLLIDADNLRLDTLSADHGSTEKGWAQEIYYLPIAINTLSWCYSKNNDNSRPDLDRVWIDNLNFNTSDIPYQTRICDALDLATNLCARIQSISFDPPQLLWIISAQNSVAGGSSLRSPDIDHDQSSCLELSLSLPADAFITAYSRTSSEGTADRLRIRTDNLNLDTISAAYESIVKNWSQGTYYLPSAITALRWCYTKDNIVHQGADSIWIDNLNFGASDIPFKNRICDVLDLPAGQCSIVESFSYTPPEQLWVITSATAALGKTSLRSPHVDIPGQDACLRINLSQAVPLPNRTRINYSRRAHSTNLDSFLYSQANTQFLEALFRPIPVPQGNINERDTAMLRNWAPLGIQTINFSISRLSLCYRILPESATDPVFRAGNEDIWVDNVVLLAPEATSPICETLDIGFANCVQINSVTYDPPESPWTVDQSTSVTGLSSLRSPDIGDDDSSCLILTLAPPLPANSLVRFSRQINAQPETDFLYFAAGDQRLEENFSVPAGETLRNWQAGEFFLPADSDTLSWCYTKDSTTSIGLDSAWVDSLSFIPADTIFCDALDLPADRCSLIQSVTYDPPLRRWETTTTEAFRGASALITPPLNADQNACVTLELKTSLPADSGLAFSWRVTSPSEQDILQFQAGTQQRQISNTPAWQTEYIALDGFETTVRWCYNRGSAADTQSTRAWLDSLLLVTPADRYQTAIDIIGSPIRISSRTNTLQYTVGVRAESPLPPPLDWILRVSGIENIIGTSTTYRLVFDNDLAQIEVLSTPDNPFLPSTVRLALIDRPSFLGTVATSISYTLPARQLGMLQILAVTSVTQTARNIPIPIAVTVIARDNFNTPFDPEGLMLDVSAVDSATVRQSNYPLTFAGGLAQTTITVGLFGRGSSGMIELSVTFGDVNAEASVFVNPAPLIPGQLGSPLNIDSADPRVTELDLILALRWLADQESSTASLVANLSINSSSVSTAGIDNLRQLFAENSDFVDLNTDGRADQLDLRILLRYLAGLRGAGLTERYSPEVTFVVRLLLGLQP